MMGRIALRGLLAPLLATGAALVPLSGAQAVTTRADMALDTAVTVTATSLQICATVTFTGSLFPNTTLSLDIAGVDDAGISVVPIVAAPISTDFTPSQTVCGNFPLQPGSTVHVDYVAQAAGLAPTPFTGNCTGTVTRSNGGTPLVVKSC